MDYRLVNKEKMIKYLSELSGQNVSVEQFQKIIDYFVDYAEFIDDVREGRRFIKERASLEIEIGEECYDVGICYNWIVEDGREVVIIGIEGI